MTTTTDRDDAWITAKAFAAMLEPVLRMPLYIRSVDSVKSCQHPMLSVKLQSGERFVIEVRAGTPDDEVKP